MNTLPPPPSSDERELDVEDAFGEHDIEYWVWSGNRLVPATPEQVAAICDYEALLHLRALKAIVDRRAYEQARQARVLRLAARLCVLPARVTATLAARFKSAAPMASSSAHDPASAGRSSDRSTPERSAR